LLVGNQGATARSAAAPYYYQKGGISITELEYQEHIRHTHNAFCRIVLLHAAISESRKLCSRWQREFSLEYLMFEKFVPFSTTDEYFAEPDEEALFTACGQTAVLENANLAAALSRLSEQEQEELFAYYFQKKKQGEIAARYGQTRSSAGRHIQIALRKLREEMDRCRHE